MLDVNLWGVVHGVHTFVPIMRRQGTPAHVVNTASVAGLLSGIAYLGPYAVSKVGVVSFSETLRAELAMAGVPIGVSVLCPERHQHQRDGSGTQPARAPRGGGADRRRATACRLGIKGGFTTAEGKEPDDVAAQVIDAVRHDRFWVVSHGGVDAMIEPRFAGILDATREGDRPR